MSNLHKQLEDRARRMFAASDVLAKIEQSEIECTNVLYDVPEITVCVECTAPTNLFHVLPPLSVEAELIEVVECQDFVRCFWRSKVYREQIRLQMDIPLDRSEEVLTLIRQLNSFQQPIEVEFPARLTRKMAIQLQAAMYYYRAFDRFGEYIDNFYERAVELYGNPLFSDWLCQLYNDGECCRSNCPLATLKCCQKQNMSDFEVCRILKNVLIKEEENVCK